MSKIENFEVIQKIEVLNEIGAGVIAEFVNQLIERNIDINDTSNPLIILYWQTVKIKNNLIKMDTIMELNNAQAQLNFVSEYVKKIRRIV